MRSVEQAFALVRSLFLDVVALVLGVFVAVEGWARGALAQAGVPRDVSNVVLILLAVLLFILALRIFGGLIRVLLVVFLALLLFHLLLSATGA